MEKFVLHLPVTRRLVSIVTYDVSVILQAHHGPFRFYWASFLAPEAERWEVGQVDVAEALTESQRKNFLGLVRAFLIENALLSLPESAPYNIPEHWYPS